MALTFARIQPREEESRKSLFLILSSLIHITFNTQRNYIRLGIRLSMMSRRSQRDSGVLPELLANLIKSIVYYPHPSIFIYKIYIVVRSVNY